MPPCGLESRACEPRPSGAGLRDTAPSALSVGGLRQALAAIDLALKELSWLPCPTVPLPSVRDSGTVSLRKGYFSIVSWGGWRAKIAVPISERKIPAQFPDIFARESQKDAKPRRIYGFRRKRRESLLNPCLGRKFADSGRDLKNQAVNGEKSLINSLQQGIRLWQSSQLKLHGLRGRL